MPLRYCGIAAGIAARSLTIFAFDYHQYASASPSFPSAKNARRRRSRQILETILYSGLLIGQLFCDVVN